MNNKSKILPALSSWAALLLAWPSMAVAQPTNADFQQAVAAYQQTPSAGTYEKVIKLAAAMDQLPPIPEEAREHFVMGQTMFKSAKSPNDFSMASQEFNKAVWLAPWWPEALYNTALACEAQDDYASAISDLKYYQLFKLPEAEARAAQDRIYALKAKQRMAEQEKQLAAQKAAEEQRAQQAATAANAAREQEELLKKTNISGKWSLIGAQNQYLRISIISGYYTGVYVMGDRTCQLGYVAKNGNNVSMQGDYDSSGDPGGGYRTYLKFHFTLSDDGTTLTGTKTADTERNDKRGRFKIGDTETEPVTFTR